MRRRRLAVLAAAAAALAMGGCGGGGDTNHEQRARVLPRGFLGIVSEDAFAQPGAYRRAQFRRQAADGITVVRQTFSWQEIERRPGRYTLGTYDAFVADAARAGLTVLPILFRAPAFHARALPPDASATTTPPPRGGAGERAMARFALALQRRYGRDGTLWREQPQLPRHPITAWQIWNEPNLPVYWGAQPSARQYVRLLRTVGTALHRGDPRAQVVTAGLPQSKLGVPFETFLRRMYAAGAYRTFDVLAINAYSRRVTGMETAVLGARRIMAAAEQGDLPIWVTEFGWATRPGPSSSMTVGPKTQARLIKTALRTLLRQRAYLGVQGIVYYAWRDARPYPGGKDFWGLHTGLLDRRGRPKPGLAALSAVTCRGERACTARSGRGS